MQMILFAAEIPLFFVSLSSSSWRLQDQEVMQTARVRLSLSCTNQSYHHLIS